MKKLIVNSWLREEIFSRTVSIAPLFGRGVGVRLKTIS